MKYIIPILFIVVLLGLATGFFIKSTDPATGDLFIGISLMTGFFVLMPLFIYHRWKNKNISDYMLNKENIQKMYDHQKDKKTE